MQTFVGSIRRPLSRAFHTLLVSIVALWALLGSASAQIYVGQIGQIVVNGMAVAGIVGKEGAAVNSSLVNGIAPFRTSLVRQSTTINTYDATTRKLAHRLFMFSVPNR